MTFRRSSRLTKRQRVRDIMKHPEQEALLEETYDEMEATSLSASHGSKTRSDLRSTSGTPSSGSTAWPKRRMEVFDDISEKAKLERNDLQLIIESIQVYEDHLEISSRRISTHPPLRRLPEDGCRDEDGKERRKF